MFEGSASSLPSPPASSIWESMNSWFTPTVLFLLLNLVIGTIAFTSTLSNQKKHLNQQQLNEANQPKIAKSTSVTQQRPKSYDFSANYRSYQEQRNVSFHSKQSTDSEALFHFEHPHQEQTPETQSHYFSPSAAHGENFKESLESESEIPLVAKSHLESEDTGMRFEDFTDELGELRSLRSMDEVYSELTKSDPEPSSGVKRGMLPTGRKKSASLELNSVYFEAEDTVEARRPATVRDRGYAKLADGDEEVDARADDFINRFKQQLKLQRLDTTVKYKEVADPGFVGTYSGRAEG